MRLQNESPFSDDVFLRLNISGKIHMLCRNANVEVKCKQTSKYVGEKGETNYNSYVLTKSWPFPVKNTAVSSLNTETRLTCEILSRENSE